MACISKDQKSATRFFLREPESKPYKSSIWEKYTFKSVGEWRIWAFDGKSWSERKDELLSLAKPNALVMHCLPAYRGKEIDEDTFEANAETIFTQAENRLHTQKAILTWLVS